MYKIMIVEDEKIEREHLVYVIESLKLPLESVLVATNGAEGLAMFDEYHPHIVIADINMPIMDGLRMIELIKQRSSDTVCFILSSYNYFTYAQKALRIGVIDFILKPSDRKAINDCLVKALEQLRLRENQREQESKLMAKMNDLNDEIMKNCFYSIITYKDEFTIQESLNLLGIKVISGVCMYMRNDDEKQMIEMAKIIEDCGYDTIYHMLDHHTVLFVLSNHTMEQQEIIKLKQVIEETFGNCNCAVGKRADEIYELIQSYEDAKRNAQSEPMMQQRVFNDEDIQKMAVRFLDLIEIDDKQGIEAQLYLPLRRLDPSRLKDQLQQLLDDTVQVFNQRYDIKLENNFILPSEFQSLQDEQQLEVIIMKTYVTIQRVLKTVQYSKHQYNYKKACAFIAANYTKPITLLTVADALRISPSYLSRLISKNGNDSFSDMINALRIKEAKKQIKQGIPFKEVSHNVGYTSQSYFTKIFRKLVGMSPSEYKNMF